MASCLSPNPEEAPCTAARPVPRAHAKKDTHQKIPAKITEKAKKYIFLLYQLTYISEECPKGGVFVAPANALGQRVQINPDPLTECAREAATLPLPIKNL